MIPRLSTWLGPAPRSSMSSAAAGSGPAGMRERLAETVDDDARLLRRERRETLCWPLECSLPHGTTGITVELTLSRNGVSLSSRLFLCADALISMTSEGGVSRLMGM